MALENFSLAALETFDSGRIKAAFEQALTRAIQDCRDRPAVEETRKLTLSVDIVPVQDEEGDLDTVSVQFRVTEKHPIRKSRRYTMEPRGDALLFNDLSHEDPRQRTIDDLGPQPTAAS